MRNSRETPSIYDNILRPTETKKPRETKTQQCISPYTADTFRIHSLRQMFMQYNIILNSRYAYFNYKFHEIRFFELIFDEIFYFYKKLKTH